MYSNYYRYLSIERTYLEQEYAYLLEWTYDRMSMHHSVQIWRYPFSFDPRLHHNFLSSVYIVLMISSWNTSWTCIDSVLSPIKNIKSDGRGHTYFTFIGRSDIDNDAIAHHLLNKEGISITYVVIKWQMLLSPRSMVSMRSQSFNLLSIPGFHGYATRGSIKWKDLQRYFDNSILDIEWNLDISLTFPLSWIRYSMNFC